MGVKNMMRWPADDKLRHGAVGYACALVVLAGALAGGLRLPSALAWAGVSALVLGVLIELRQMQLNDNREAAGLPPSHDIEAADALATFIGGALVVLPYAVPWLLLSLKRGAP